MTDLEAKLSALEARLARLEDELAITKLIASYGPTVDSCSSALTVDLFAEGGGFDSGPVAATKADLQGFLDSPQRRAAEVDKGAAHIASMPRIEIRGDRAVALTYTRLYLRDDGQHNVARVSANRWDLVRTQDGWRIANRVNRLFDGSEAPRTLFADAL